METIRELLIDGLTIDGGHHKQYYLDQIQQLLGFKLEEVCDFEEGIAP